MMFFLKFLTIYMKYLKYLIPNFTSLNIFNKKQTKNMKKLFFVLIAALTLTSVQSSAQTWGSVLAGDAVQTWVTSIVAKQGTNHNDAPSQTGLWPIAGGNGATAQVFQLVNNPGPSATPYTTSVPAASGSTRITYYFAFLVNGTYYYASYTGRFNDSDGSLITLTDRFAGSSGADISQSIRNQNTPLPNVTNQNVPIDGGVSVLLGAGALAHLRRKKIMAKFNNA
jgi:hypothetical protein